MYSERIKKYVTANLHLVDGTVEDVRKLLQNCPNKYVEELVSLLRTCGVTYMDDAPPQWVKEIQTQFENVDMNLTYNFRFDNLQIHIGKDNKNSVGYITSAGRVGVHWTWFDNVKRPSWCSRPHVMVLSTSGPMFEFETIQEFKNSVIYDKEVNRWILQ